MESHVSPHALAARFRLFAMAIIGLIGVGVIRAQGPTVAVDVDDPRPLAAASDELERRFGWIVTYEDPPYLREADLADVSAQVRRDAQKKPVIVPRGGVFRFSYAPVSDAAAPQALAVVSAMVDAYHTSGHSAAFRVTQAGDAVHVVPTMAPSASGQLLGLRPMLDTVISTSSGKRTALEQLREIAAAVSARAGRPMQLGTVPLNLLQRTAVNETISGEAARTALMRTLKLTGQPLSWRLFYAPGPEASFFLNVHSVVREPASIQ